MSRLCTGLWSRRDLTLLDCLWPSLDFTPVLAEGVDGCLKSGELANGLGGKSEVGSGRCVTKLGFLPVELVELALLEAEEVEGAGELKVTFFAVHLHPPPPLLRVERVPVSYTHLTLPTICSV